MAKILLDYVFPVSVITPTPAASTAFLKQVCVVAKPKSGQEGNVGELYECTSMTQVAVRTNNTNAQQLFNAGMAKVFVLLADDLDLEAFMDEHGQQFYTVIVSDDFDEADVAGEFATGIITVSSYANLVSGTDDGLTIEGVLFTAQTGAATLGTATFQAATSDEATAASLALQINNHATTKELVVATVVDDAVTLTAKVRGTTGNDIDVSYTDNDTNVGIVLSGLSGGKLSGGTDDALALGTFEGVSAVFSSDVDFLEEQAVIENRVAFYGNDTNTAKNMFYAFGKLLSNLANWSNQQYIAMPFNDGIETMGTALSLFDKKISFVLNDDEFGNRLALFAVGLRAIAAPYILKNLRVDMQSRALQWISGNQPAYTLTNASLLENRLQDDVINDYIDRGWIEKGVIAISLDESGNFVASGEINVSEPKALWRVVNQMQQTL